MTILIDEITVLHETEGLALGIVHGETEGGGCVGHYDFVDFQFADDHICIDHRLWGFDGFVNFRLPHQSDEG